MCSTPSRPPEIGLGDHGLHAACAVRERAHEHRQVDAGDELDAAGHLQLAREVAGRRAVDVREDEHAVAGVELAHALARVGQEIERIVGGRHRQRLELRRLRAEHVRDGLDQAVGQRVVRDDEDADHRCAGAPEDGSTRFRTATMPGRSDAIGPVALRAGRGSRAATARRLS